MAKEKKQRADKYEEKVSFDGTFEDMVKISVKDAEKRVNNHKSSMHIFRLEYLIFSDGKSIGSGNQTTHSTDPNNNGWNTVRDKVLEQLRNKYPDKPFAVKLHTTRTITEEQAKELTNGWITELDS